MNRDDPQDTGQSSARPAHPPAWIWLVGAMVVIATLTNVMG